MRPQMMFGLALGAVLLTGCGSAAAPTFGAPQSSSSSPLTTGVATIAPSSATTSSPAIMTSSAPGPPSAATPLASVAGQVIAVGGLHACALPGDGTVKCWGDNSRGQLGNGKRTNPLATAGENLTSPVTVIARPGSSTPLTGVTAIAAGTEHTCALLADSTVKCWGANVFVAGGDVPQGDVASGGQLGDGTMTDRLTPVTVIAGPARSTPLTGVSAITAGSGQTCALLADGTAKCWGQLPAEGSRTAPVTVVAGSGSSSPLSGITAIAAGDGHTCAILVDGTTKCWGGNFQDALGDGTSGFSLTPITVIAAPGSTGALSDAAALAVGHGFQFEQNGNYGGGHSCALLTDNTVKCWGTNAGGQLGDGTVADHLGPVTVVSALDGLPALSGVKAVTAGVSHTCALLSDRTVKCWGFGYNPQDIHPIAPLTVMTVAGGSTALSGVTAIAAGGYQTCAILADGTVTCWASQFESPATISGLVISSTAGPVAAATPASSGAATAGGVAAIVQAFYKYYLTDAAYGDLVGRPDVTPGFIQWLKSFAGAANPIVCAQDNPDSVQAGTAVVAGSSATVTTTEVWNGVLQSPGSGPKVSLALGPVGWQISAVDCGFPPLP